MTGATHSRAALAAFTDGETRLVYARHKGNPSGLPFHLQNGQARNLDRVWVREHLECLMPECPDPVLSVVNRSEHGTKTDGFSHRKGTRKHTPESLFHQQGKALIQRWVTQTYPDVQVQVEKGVHNERVADVLLTWPTGQKVAVEIQYAALTVEQWTTRTRSYLNNGVVPVWLFGHHGHHLKTAFGGDTVPLSAVHKASVELGLPVLWVNPTDGTIATPWRTVSVYGVRYELHPNSETETVALTIDPLTGCRLDPTYGLITPTLETVTAREQDYRDHVERLAEAKRQADEERRVRWFRNPQTNTAPKQQPSVRQAQTTADDHWFEENAPYYRTSPPRPGDTRATCPACGLKVDPILKTGYHVLCGPSHRPARHEIPRIFEPEPDTPHAPPEQETLF